MDDFERRSLIETGIVLATVVGVLAGVLVITTTWSTGTIIGLAVAAWLARSTAPAA